MVNTYHYLPSQLISLDWIVMMNEPHRGKFVNEGWTLTAKYCIVRTIQNNTSLNQV